LQLHRLAGGSATGLSATGAWAILVSLDGAAADDSGSMRLILKTSETFVRHWQNRPLTDSKRATPLGPVGVSIAVGAVPLSHVVETSRLAHHVGRMSRKEPKRSGGSDQNKAIARWDNEGGAPKKIAMNWHLSLTKRSIFCGASAPQSSCNGTIFPQKSSANFLNMRVPWVS
jgi:hypothetical protein